MDHPAPTALPSAHDVADELRRRHAGVGDVKLHKLLYYVQGWHLAATGTPAFREDVEAWANGPVVADLWADLKHDRPRPAPRAVPTATLVVVDYVTRRYGSRSGKELIRQTHAEDPWRDVSESDSTWRSAEITHAKLGDFFADDADFGTVIELVAIATDDRDPAFTADTERLRASAVYTLDLPVESDDDVLAAVRRARVGDISSA